MKQFKFQTLIVSIFLLFQGNILGQCADPSNIYTFNHDGHSYEVVKENKTWTDAVDCAISRGGYLAEINDVSEQNAIFDELTNNAGIVTANTQNQFGTASVWLGGSDAVVEGNWIWDGNNDGVGPQFWMGGPNGNAVGGLYTNWGTNPPEPDNAVGGQDRLTIIIRPTAVNFGLWNDLTSTNTIYYLIEYDGILSVKETELNHKINIYPNPFTDFIQITNQSQESIQTVEILNVLGQNQMTINSTEIADNAINVSDLSKGTYIVNIHLKNGVVLKKKIIK